ncbi:response regulator transcription factor [Bacillus horti]|uniref:DNA-binding NarL/FixJ family response regulator n=1 Tax=Caldalkalibacillus horti TaxID=77523 RepID=A0ABT9VUQ3_9BACI|nr:response regulator transcription factor [Bacillus horti]MDQ0164721.1 DNA-binding NarL/FixJ family response regulator [Bacillus horti]
MIRILIAEDQAMVRQGLKMMIETDQELRVVGEASNGQEAIHLCERLQFDLVVMDIRMPQMDGLEATRIIRSRWPKLKVLILTTFNDDEYALTALQNGANGYMLKDAEPDLLIRAIRSCLTGGLSLEENVAAKVMPRLLHGKENEEQFEVDSSLTPRELDICRLVGLGKSNREIAEELSLSIGTVKNHISLILDKLELRDRTQLAIYAIRHHLV